MVSPPATQHGKRGHSLVEQSCSLAIILREEFGVPFTLHDALTGQEIPLPEKLSRVKPDSLPGLVVGIAEKSRAWVTPRHDGHYQVFIPLSDQGKPVLVAVGVVAGLAHNRGESAQEQFRLEKWAQAVGERLETAHQASSGSNRKGGTERQAAQAWEGLIALDRVLRRVRMHKNPGANQKRILQAATELLSVQTLLWVPRQADPPVLIAGDPFLTEQDGRHLALYLSRSPGWDSAGVLINNQVSGTGWGARLEKIENLMALTTAQDGEPGCVIALNRYEKTSGSSRKDLSPVVPNGEGETLTARLIPFRRSEAALLTPFLSLMGLQMGSAQKFQELKDLLVGLTRALTSAIDAKDPYTYGHSERVARIAVELAREMGLADDEIGDVYLAGLMHDIGKIGVRDEILGKKEKLTAQEMEHIQQHPTIGYRILADLRCIAYILGGVLHHHERFDGRGYPAGLKGEGIPFLARIIAVADSFDAMNTNRPYRTALSRGRILEILSEGAGTQWDKKVVETLLRCQEKLYAVRQRGVGESLRQALDDALRHNPELSDKTVIGPKILLT